MPQAVNPDAANFSAGVRGTGGSGVVPLVLATAVALVMPPLTEVPVMVPTVTLPSAPSTMLLLPELGFLRLVVDNVDT